MHINGLTWLSSIGLHFFNLQNRVAPSSLLLGHNPQLLVSPKLCLRAVWGEKQLAPSKPMAQSMQITMA